MTLRADVQLPYWLPDDTEESILGTGLHLEAISILRDGLWALGPERGAPWGVGSQISLLGMVKNDGTAYDPMPDVFVHPRPVDPAWSSLSLLDDGPPLLVIEVASPSTVARDVGDKADAYFRAGVREYLVFDTTGDLLGGSQVWARRAGPGGIVPWHADGRGWWWSEAVGVYLAPEGVRLRVRDRDGALVLLSSEARRAQLLAGQERLALEQRLAAEAEARARLEAELRLLRGDQPDGNGDD